MFALVSLIATDPFIAVIGVLLFPTLALMNRSFARRMEGPARRAQERIGDVSAVAHESIDGALVVKTLGREADEIERLAVKRARAARRAGPGRVHPRGRSSRRSRRSRTSAWSCSWPSGRGGSRRAT